MAPERFEGRCDARSDVYSLGLTLYELVALRPAYVAADRHALIERMLHEEPARLKKLASRVPRDLETIIAKATARDPAARYATAAALAEDLQRFVEDRPIRARRAGLTERAWRWCKRNPWLASTTGATAAALVAVAVIATVYATEQAAAKRKIREALGRSNRLAVDLETSLKVSEQRLKTLNYERARTSLERGRAACDRGEMGPGLLDLVESWRSAVAAGDSTLEHVARASLSAWRHQSPRLLQEFPHGDKGSIRSVALRPDGQVLATGGTDNLVRVWDAATGQPIGPPLHPGAVHALEFSPDGKILLIGITQQAAQLWDAATGKPISSPLTHRGPISAVAFRPDSKAVLTGSADGTARVWGAAGKLICPPLTHQFGIYAVAFSPDGKAVLTGGYYDQMARVWDAATGQPIGPPLTHQGAVRAVAFGPDGKTVLTGSGDGTARLWDAATGQPVGIPLAHPGAVYLVAFSRDGQLALTGARDGVRVWDAATGQPVAMRVQEQGAVALAVFRGDGRAVLTSVEDGTARLWDTTTAVSPVGRPLTHGGAVLAVAFSPDGKAVLTGSYDRTARVWDAATGKPIGPPLTHQSYVLAVAFSPDGKAVLTGSYDRTARAWDATTGRPLTTPLRHQGAVQAVAFSSDGKAVLTASTDRTARVWDAVTGQPIRPPLTHQGEVSAVAFDPGGKAVLTGSADGTARLWDAATGQPIGPPLTHQGAVHVVAFGPDGKAVLTVGSDQTARVWDAATGRLIGSSGTQRERLSSAALSPDGRRILTGSADRMARLWDAATGQPLGPPLPHPGPVVKVLFSPDGQTALTAGGDDARLWDVAELPDDLPRLGDWVHVRTDLALDERGQVKNLDGSAWREHRDRLAARGGAPEAEPRWRLDPILFGPEPTARAKAWAERKRWAEAETAFTEAVAARPVDPAIRLERARFYTSRSQTEKAAEDYARLYALGSRDATLIETIAGSEPLFRRAVAESPRAAAPLWARHGALRVSQARWDEAAADFDRELELMPKGRKWDTPRSDRARELARWDKAYARLLELRPDDGQLWCVRGRYYALRGHWEQAAADFARGIASAPPESEEWFEHACLRLIVGDHQGYRSFVCAIRRRAGSTEDPFVAFVLARTAIMTAEPVVEPVQAVRWAEQALESNLNAWYLHALGLAHYRAGQLDRAIRRLEQSNAGNWKERGKMQNRLVLAMAHHRLGHEAPARALLEEVERWWKDIEAAKTEGEVEVVAIDWLPLQLLRREAEALIRYDPAFPADPFAR